jgi:hypothetical protein
MSPRTLFRPVGLRELELILESDARRFPPRLPEQPIFYPVLNREYAEQIARDWNTGDPRSGFAGFVTEFEVLADHVQQFEPKVVGAAQHQELWVPAERLPEFNANLASRIRFSKAFYGADYEGPMPLPLLIRARHPAEQLKALSALLPDYRFDFACEVAANWKLILANFGYWAAIPAERQGLTSEAVTQTLGAIAKVWRQTDLPLPSGEFVPLPR